MPGKLIECVPNFSEGRRQEVIDASSDAFGTERGVIFLITVRIRTITAWLSVWSESPSRYRMP